MRKHTLIIVVTIFILANVFMAVLIQNRIEDLQRRIQDTREMLRTLKVNR